MPMRMGMGMGAQQGVVASIPQIPVAAAATDTAITGFTANWAAATGAISYALDYSQDETFATGVTTVTGITDLFKVVTGLSPGIQYYYRVRGVNAIGSSGNSTVISINDWFFSITRVSSNNRDITLKGTAGKVVSLTGTTFSDGTTSKNLTGDTDVLTIKPPASGSAVCKVQDGRNHLLTVQIAANQASSYSFTFYGKMPPTLTNLSLLCLAADAWSYSGVLPNNLEFLRLQGSGLNWTGLDVGNGGTMTYFNLSDFRTSALSAEQFSTLIQSINQRTASQLPSTGTIGEVPDLRDTNQGGIWGTFTGTPGSDTPSALSIALKSVVKTKVMALTLNTWQCVIPGASPDDGTGFPTGFGNWWRA